MIICYDNKVLDATITASSEQAGYGASVSLKDPRLCRKWKAYGALDEYVIFDMGAAVAVTNCILANTNLTASATVRVEANSSDSWATPAFSSVLAQYGDKWSATFTAQTYRYWRVYLDDATNPDALYLGAAFIGPALTMPGMAPDQEIPTKSSAQTVFSIGGQAYGDRRIRYKTASINFPYISLTDKDLIDDFFDVVDITNPFFLLVWEDDLTIEPPIYCVLTKDLVWSIDSTNSGRSYKLSLEFQEAK